MLRELPAPRLCLTIPAVADDAPTRPLTPNMLAVLQHLAQSGDRALIRAHSQWWVRESDNLRNTVFHGELQDLSGRMLESGSWLTKAPPTLMVQTATVNAMAARGLLKKVGPKRPVLCGSVGVKDHWRAELTPAGTARRAEIEDKAQAAYERMLQAAKGGPGA